MSHEIHCLFWEFILLESDLKTLSFRAFNCANNGLTSANGWRHFSGPITPCTCGKVDPIDPSKPFRFKTGWKRFSRFEPCISSCHSCCPSVNRRSWRRTRALTPLTASIPFTTIPTQVIKGVVECTLWHRANFLFVSRVLTHFCPYHAHTTIFDQTSFYPFFFDPVLFQPQNLIQVRLQE